MKNSEFKKVLSEIETVLIDPVALIETRGAWLMVCTKPKDGTQVATINLTPHDVRIDRFEQSTSTEITDNRWHVTLSQYEKIHDVLVDHLLPLEIK